MIDHWDYNELAGHWEAYDQAHISHRLSMFAKHSADSLHGLTGNLTCYVNVILLDHASEYHLDYDYEDENVRWAVLVVVEVLEESWILNNLHK